MQSQPYNILNLGQNIFFEGDTHLWAGAGMWNLPFEYGGFRKWGYPQIIQNLTILVLSPPIFRWIAKASTTRWHRPQDGPQSAPTGCSGLDRAAVRLCCGQALGRGLAAGQRWVLGFHENGGVKPPKMGTWGLGPSKNGPIFDDLTHMSISWVASVELPEAKHGVPIYHF